MHAAPLTGASTDADGRVAPVFRAALADAVALYRHMVTLRLVSARMVDLQRSEKVAFHAASLGDEAFIAGATLAAREGDWVFPGVREWGAALVRGLPVVDYMHHAFGSGKDAAKGHSAPDHPPAKRFRVAPASGVAGAHVPQAVGAAWAAKIKKDDVATIALFDESATVSGDLHNAFNFAGVFKPACAFVCRTAAAGGGKAAAARERALAYGIASASVDGSDALAVLTVVRSALARARAPEGKGATLIEAVSSHLDVAVATEKLLVDAWRRGDPELLSLGEADPLVRLRRVLEHEKLLDGATDAAIAAEARAAIDAAVSLAEREGPPPTASIFEDVYADVPAHLRAQKESSPWRR
jgi:TPP-dependent pyruvate/acetoin dehydrogenase alpha subunit